MNKRTKLNAKRTRRAARVRARIESGSERPRLSVFRSNHAFYAQLIDDMKGHTLAAVSVRELPKAKRTKSEAAANVGTLLAEKAKKLGITKAVFDRGRYPFAGRVKAFAEAVRGAGFTI